MTLFDLFEDSKDWPKNIRRMYVIGWPIFMPLRILLGITIAIFILIMYIAMYFAGYFVGIWNGEKPSWHPDRWS